LPHYEVSLQRPAETFLRSLDEHDQAELGRLLEILEIDPKTDGHHKTIFMVPPVGFSLYADSKFWILYHIAQNTIVSVLNIDYADARVTPWR